MDLEKLNDEEAHYLIGKEIFSMTDYLTKSKNGLNKKVDSYESLKGEIKKTHKIDFSSYDRIVLGVLEAKLDQKNSRFKNLDKELENLKNSLPED